MKKIHEHLQGKYTKFIVDPIVQTKINLLAFQGNSGYKSAILVVPTSKLLIDLLVP